MYLWRRSLAALKIKAAGMSPAHLVDYRRRSSRRYETEMTTRGRRWKNRNGGAYSSTAGRRARSLAMKYIGSTVAAQLAASAVRHGSDAHALGRRNHLRCGIKMALKLLVNKCDAALIVCRGGLTRNRALLTFNL